MRINVIGTSGSGKSTFCKQLAQQFSIPHIEMDALFWKPNWEKTSYDEFIKEIEIALEQDSWILDGDYTKTIPIKWKTVDIVIWIDYSFSRTLYQTIKRSIARLITKKELWPGTENIETLTKIFSKDSIILWTITHYQKNRRKYKEAFLDPKYSHIEFIRIKKPKDMEKLIFSLHCKNET